MEDVSAWTFTGYGENSTLEKIELLSPQNEPYVMKYPRQFSKDRTNWEDVNEVIAAKIAQLLDIQTIDARIGYRDGKRGCLMKHFHFQLGSEYGETAATLLSSEFGKEYENLHENIWVKQELPKLFLNLFEKSSHISVFKEEFVFMNLFDLLIGNQDRHAHNWQVLYKQGKSEFGPLYDNGASLGWQLPEDTLRKHLINESKMNKFYKGTKIKLGLDNKETPRMKAVPVMNEIIEKYPVECMNFCKKLENFSQEQFEKFIAFFPLISETRKEFLVKMINMRLYKITTTIKEGVSKRCH